MIPSFEKVAFSLVNESDYSKPFKTSYGWHIVKLLKKHPVASFEEMKKSLEDKIKWSDRNQLSKAALVNKVKDRYNIVVYEQGKKNIETKEIKDLQNDTVAVKLLSIEDKVFSQKDFANFAVSRNSEARLTLFQKFKEDKIYNFHKDNLIHIEPKYAAIVKEYQEGLLLFELMQQKVWAMPEKDSLGLQDFFNKNKSLYKGKELSDVRGELISKYQDFLEKKLITDLRNKSEVSIKKRALRRLINHYEDNK